MIETWSTEYTKGTLLTLSEIKQRRRGSLLLFFDVSGPISNPQYPGSSFLSLICFQSLSSLPVCGTLLPTVLLKLSVRVVPTF
jgi:hypothetical protein